MLEETLQKHFGYKEFRSGQKEVIEQIIRGKDVLTLLPTGSGKSLCYQLPAYLLGGTTLVISPLLSLMQDQVEQLKRFGEKKVVAINSFLTGNDRQQVFQSLSTYRFIFVSPEMLSNLRFQQALEMVNLTLIAIDEAHCISQWGFDFRPEYLQIGEILKNPQRPPILALTATATSKVLQDIEFYLQMQTPFQWIASVDRPNIAYQVIQINDYREKVNWLQQHINRSIAPGIVYTQSRKKTMAYAEALRAQNIRVAAYHGGMEKEDRQLIQHQFLAGELDWIIATNAFGMGVHKSDIRQIIHDHMPSTMGSYMQEVGRAGRDGQQSFATLLYSPEDERLTKSVSLMDYPNRYQISRYSELVARGQSPQILLDEYQMTETSYRILAYWMKQLSPEDVVLKVEQLSNDKIQEVDRIRSILLGDTCIREGISHYFEQKLQNRPEICCSNCGITIESIPAKQMIENDKKRELSWSRRFNDLFPS
ncbi:MAG: ATP-dependent DNA helicase RecQ [Kurthia sp.]|nr:ATP-dependent DNA helicase RecQ [Candidatus Kurthia equi]